MSSQQEGETVASGWDPVKQEQKFEKLKPLSHDDERCPSYYYLDENGMKDKIAHFETIEQRLDSLLSRCKVLEGEEGKSIGLVAEGKAEVDAALEDFRSEYLQQEYGKDVLKTLRDEAQANYKKVVGELGELKTSDKGKVTGKGLKLKIYNLQESIKSASPNKQECLEEVSYNLFYCDFTFNSDSPLQNIAVRKGPSSEAPHRGRRGRRRSLDRSPGGAVQRRSVRVLQRRVQGQGVPGRRSLQPRP